MIETRFPDLEMRLRENAPVLPTSLKNRTLSRVAQTRRARQERRHRALQFAVAGVFSLQLLTLARLDAQNAQLIAGNGPAPTFAPISFSQLAALLNERSRQIALLLEPSKLG